jgi:hypothetical protein
VVEFPGAQPRGEALPILLDLVDRGIVRIIDLLFLRKDPDGSAVVLEISDLDGDGVLDVEVARRFVGCARPRRHRPGRRSGRAGQGRRDPGLRDLWAAPFVAALHRAGGALVAAGRIPTEDLSAALDDTEPVEA